MARGAKKSLQEKITLKEELIESLSIRIKKEREELNELLEQQKNELELQLQEAQRAADQVQFQLDTARDQLQEAQTQVLRLEGQEKQHEILVQAISEAMTTSQNELDVLNRRNTSDRERYAAQQAKIEGRVIVQFVVGKDGSVSGVKVMRGVSPELDAEAIRVVSMMPKWIPGKQRGKAVAVKYTMPIMFRLQTPASEKEKNSSPIVMEVEEGASKKSVDGVMDLVRPNSQKEDAPVIRINGTEDKLPLVVVDGEVKGNGTAHLSKVSVDQIESISVLKGATAEAEYGDKAKDGAIIITTKKNKK